MLLLGGLIGLLFMGVAIDAISAGEDEESPPQADEPGLRIVGSEGPDGLTGAAGDDRLSGRGGDDDLQGGQGDDTLSGGDGSDWIHGDGDFGPGGNDLLLGGAGDDLLAGQGGDDTARGGGGDDTIFGGEGDDLLLGGAGNDWISGNAGNDTLVAGPGEDDLDGGEGNDLLLGWNEPGRAWLHGGAGQDTLNPRSGDFAEGGAGRDLFLLDEPGVGMVEIGDYDPVEDRIELRWPGNEGDPPPEVRLEPDGNGATIIRLDGEAVGRVLGAEGLTLSDIILTRITPQG